MSSICQAIRGTLISEKQRTALSLDPDGQELCLRYALITRETESLILPEVVLDDWGHERRTLELYRWIHDNGHYFPRAEVFGQDPKGKKQQYFLRELDLMARYPCFAYDSRSMLVRNGRQIEFIIEVVEDTGVYETGADSSNYDWPMSNAAVLWCRVSTEALDSLISELLSSDPE